MQIQSQKSKVPTSPRLRGTSKGQAGATTMAQLLANQKTSFVSTKKGNILKGKIIKLTPSEILIDINTKANAVVLEKEKHLLRQMLAFLKVGDEVNVTILNPESDFGYPVVSLRRFLDNLIWQKLESLKKEKTTITVSVTDHINGGYIVVTKNGISGFLPNSQVSFSENLQDLTNQKIEASVLELNKETHRIIFSQKTVLGTEEFEKAMKTFKKGQKINSIVSNITPFGVFVSIPIDAEKTGQGQKKYVDGLVHISEISWDKVSNLEEMFKQGDQLEVIIIDFDSQTKRVNLSLKRKTIDPFEEIAKKYSVDKKVTAKVLKIISSGVILEIEEGIEAFLRKEKIPPTVVYKEGDEIKATIIEVDAKKHRISVVPVLLEKPIGYK